MKTKKELTRNLIKLLGINGVSRSTYNVERYVINRLDKIEGIKISQDDNGNIVAFLSNDDSVDALSLGINAHMDTVYEFGRDRKIYHSKDGEDILYTNDKCLGADDRAGLEIVLSLMEDFGDLEGSLRNQFKGNLIAWITVDEEIGCVGAEQLAKTTDLFKSIDMSITFDRRNKRDIVVRNAWQDFCTDSYANVFVKASAMLGMDYKTTTGGISDAMVSSEQSINSVNLSVGYDNEHTTSEQIDLNAFYDTYKLAIQFMSIINEEADSVEDFVYDAFSTKYFYDMTSEVESGKINDIEYDFSINTVNITQKYHGSGREYHDNVYIDSDDFLEIVAEYIVQNPSAYDELQRKITRKQVY